MVENELRRRAVALTSVLLLACTFVLYETARVSPTRVNDTTGWNAAQQTSKHIRETGRDQVLPMITAALRDNDFSKARELTSRLANQSTRNQLFAVVKSAEQHQVVQTIASGIRTERFADARSAATVVSDHRVRDEMEQIIDFAEGRHALINRDPVSAASAMNRLRPGVKRTLLLIGSAAESNAEGHRASSLAMLRLALDDVNSAAPNNRRQLLVMIARILLQVDPEAGLDVLDRALHERDSTVAVSGPVLIGIAGGTFYETLSAGDSRYAFSLAVQGAQGNVQELLLANHGRLRCTHGHGKSPDVTTTEQLL